MQAVLILHPTQDNAWSYMPRHAAQGQSINLEFLCLLDYLLLELPRHAFTAELQQRTLCIRAEVKHWQVLLQLLTYERYSVFKRCYLCDTRLARLEAGAQLTQL